MVLKNEIVNTPRRRAIFLDRDGVINEPPLTGRYITSPRDLRLMPGVGRALRQLRDDGFLLIVVTNQRCVALGLLSTQMLDQIHRHLRRVLSLNGAPLDAVYCCPHDDADACDCRKPNPGMLRRAAREHQIDLHGSWMIGDSERDLLAGQAAGCRTVLFARGAEALGSRYATKIVCNWSELDHLQ